MSCKPGLSCGIQKGGEKHHLNRHISTDHWLVVFLCFWHTFITPRHSCDSGFFLVHENLTRLLFCISVIPFRLWSLCGLCSFITCYGGETSPRLIKQTSDCFQSLTMLCLISPVASEPCCSPVSLQQLLKMRDDLKQREAELEKSLDDKQQLKNQVQTLKEGLQNLKNTHRLQVSLRGAREGRFHSSLLGGWVWEGRLSHLHFNKKELSPRWLPTHTRYWSNISSINKGQSVIIVRYIFEFRKKVIAFLWHQGTCVGLPSSDGENAQHPSSASPPLLQRASNVQFMVFFSDPLDFSLLEKATFCWRARILHFFHTKCSFSVSHQYFLSHWKCLITNRRQTSISRLRSFIRCGSKNILITYSPTPVETLAPERSALTASCGSASCWATISF